MELTRGTWRCLDNLLTKPFVRLGDRLPRFSSVFVVSTVLTQPRFCKKRQESGWGSSNAHPPPTCRPTCRGQRQQPTHDHRPLAKVVTLPHILGVLQLGRVNRYLLLLTPRPLLTLCRKKGSRKASLSVHTHLHKYADMHTARTPSYPHN